MWAQSSVEVYIFETYKFKLSPLSSCAHSRHVLVPSETSHGLSTLLRSLFLLATTNRLLLEQEMKNNFITQCRINSGLAPCGLVQ